MCACVYARATMSTTLCLNVNHGEATPIRRVSFNYLWLIPFEETGERGGGGGIGLWGLVLSNSRGLSVERCYYTTYPRSK